MLGAPHDSGALQHNSLATRKPDITSNSIRREDQRPDGDAVCDVQQGGIATLMRSEVVVGEPDLIRTAVAVDGEVDESFARALHDVLGDEAGGQHPVAPFSWDVVFAVPSEDKVPSEKPGPMDRLDHASSDNGSVLISVAGEEVLAKLRHQVCREHESPRTGHLDAIQSSTF